MLALVRLAFGLTATPTYAQQIEPEADKILHSMADYVAGLKSFTVNYEVETEVVDTDGQKLQYSASGSVAVERPGKLHVSRKGAFVDAELTFDGKTISIYGKKANVYGQLESPGPTIDDAVEEVRAATGFDAAGADLFAADSYAVLTEDATKGVYVSSDPIGGVECDHLAFRNPRVDWQVWVKKGEQPLPLKYVITTKWVTGAPQFAVRLSDWNVTPQIDPAQFTFTAPEGARKVEEISGDEIGELSAEEHNDQILFEVGRDCRCRVRHDPCRQRRLGRAFRERCRRGIRSRRPTATPGSVAGVARRTTRRVVRRSTIYVARCRRVVCRRRSTAASCGGAAAPTTSHTVVATWSYISTDENGTS